MLRLAPTIGSPHCPMGVVDIMVIQILQARAGTLDSESYAVVGGCPP